MRALAAVALAMAALGACSISDPVVGPGGVVNTCTNNSQCREGVCDLTRQRCVAVARPEVFFRVVPADGRVTPDAFPTLTSARAIRTGEAVDLAMRAPRTVYGTVAVPGDRDEPMHIAATVLFTPSDLPEVVPPIEAVAASEALAPVNNDRVAHTWDAVLSDGAYDVLVRPAMALRGRVPPRFERRFDVRFDSAWQRFDLLYPLTYPRWSGVVVDRNGAPVSGLTVRAVDPTRANVEASTTSVTAPQSAQSPGAFAVDVGPGATGEWVLRVTSDVDGHGGLVFDVPWRVCRRLDATGREVTITLPTSNGVPLRDPMAPSGPPGDIARACTGCVRVTGSVEGRSASGATSLLRGASVTLHSTIALDAASPLAPESRAWFESRVQTDADGSFTAWLVPGDYDVSIEPQGGEFANAVRHPFRVRNDAATQAGQVFTVDARIPVEGRVITARGEPMGNAHLQAVPFAAAFVNHACLNELDMRALAPRANPGEASTASDGSYRFDLDPGLYRIVVEPPSGAGFATTLSQTVCVASRIRALDVVMQSPVEVHGVVRDARDRAAPGARVEAVVRVREAGAGGVVVRVARATANANGAYTLLLPGDTAVAQ